MRTQLKLQSENSFCDYVLYSSPSEILNHGPNFILAGHRIHIRCVFFAGFFCIMWWLVLQTLAGLSRGFSLCWKSTRQFVLHATRMERTTFIDVIYCMCRAETGIFPWCTHFYLNINQWPILKWVQGSQWDKQQ